MLQRPSRPDRSDARVAHLTPKERECLERWLGHATAKEIALDLGITHHAVEKRLKSARAKLGVSSTLEAARLLAAGDYGLTVSQSPEVENTSLPEDPPVTTSSSERPDEAPRRWGLIAGVVVMTLILVAAAAFFATAERTEQQTASRSATPQVTIVNRTGGAGAGDIDAAFNRAFDAFDKDRNGFLEGSEVMEGNVRLTRVRNGNANDSRTSESPFSGFDTNKDGRVSRAEFIGNAKSDDRDHR